MKEHLGYHPTLCLRVLKCSFSLARTDGRMRRLSFGITSSSPSYRHNLFSINTNIYSNRCFLINRKSREPDPLNTRRIDPIRRKEKEIEKRIVFYSAIRRGLFAALSTCSSSRSASADAKSVGEIIGIQCLPPPVPSAPNR